MLWEWLSSNLDTIVETLGKGIAGFSWIWRCLVEGLSTKEQAVDVKEFFEGKDTTVLSVALSHGLLTRSFHF